MPNQELTNWYVGGLQTMVAAAEASEQVANQNASAANSPELRTMLEEGSKIAGKQTGMIKDLLHKAGGRPDGRRDAVIDAIIQAGCEDVAAAGDPQVADIAVIATTRIGLHYYVAAYGSLAATAKHLGRDQEAAVMAEMIDHMTSKDEEYARLAERMLAEQLETAA